MEIFIPQPRSVIVLLLAVSTLTFGCDSESADSPEEVANAFLLDLRQSNDKEAMEAIWPETQEKLQSSYGEVETYLEEELPFESEELLVATRVESPMFIRRMDPEGPIPEEPKYGDRVLLKIEFRDDSSGEIALRWGEGRWYVDLPVDDAAPLDVPRFEAVEDPAEAPTEDDHPEAPLDLDSNQAPDENNSDE